MVLFGMVSQISYKIYEIAEFIVMCIFEVLKPTLIVIFFIIISALMSIGFPLYIIYLSVYNTVIYIKESMIRRRYQRLREENDELLHDFVEEKHIISVIREYADE